MSTVSNNKCRRVRNNGSGYDTPQSQSQSIKLQARVEEYRELASENDMAFDDKGDTILTPLSSSHDDDDLEVKLHVTSVPLHGRPQQPCTASWPEKDSTAPYNGQLNNQHVTVDKLADDAATIRRKIEDHILATIDPYDKHYAANVVDRLMENPLAEVIAMLDDKALLRRKTRNASRSHGQHRMQSLAQRRTVASRHGDLKDMPSGRADREKDRSPGRCVHSDEEVSDVVMNDRDHESDSEDKEYQITQRKDRARSQFHDPLKADNGILPSKGATKSDYQIPDTDLWWTKFAKPKPSGKSMSTPVGPHKRQSYKGPNTDTWGVHHKFIAAEQDILGQQRLGSSTSRLALPPPLPPAITYTCGRNYALQDHQMQLMKLERLKKAAEVGRKDTSDVRYDSSCNADAKRFDEEPGREIDPTSNKGNHPASRYARSTTEHTQQSEIDYKKAQDTHRTLSFNTVRTNCIDHASLRPPLAAVSEIHHMLPPNKILSKSDARPEEQILSNRTQKPMAWPRPASSRTTVKEPAWYPPKQQAPPPAQNKKSHLGSIAGYEPEVWLDEADESDVCSFISAATDTSSRTRVDPRVLNEHIRRTDPLAFGDGLYSYHADRTRAIRVVDKYGYLTGATVVVPFEGYGQGMLFRTEDVERADVDVDADSRVWGTLCRWREGVGFHDESGNDEEGEDNGNDKDEEGEVKGFDEE